MFPWVITTTRFRFMMKLQKVQVVWRLYPGAADLSPCVRPVYFLKVVRCVSCTETHRLGSDFVSFSFHSVTFRLKLEISWPVCEFVSCSARCGIIHGRYDFGWVFFSFFSSILFKFFFFLTVLTVNPGFFLSLMLRPKEKCALNVNLSLRVWVCVHARTGLYIWGCDCVFLCFNVCCFYCLFFYILYIFFFCLCHKPWCDCSSHVCACVGTSYQHHECRCCQFDFIFIFLLQRSWVWFLLLLCAVVSFGAVKTDSWQDVFFLFFGSRSG